MADWTSSMQQTFEYYIVDPVTWKDSKKIENVKSCSINRDSSVETLGSATIDITESVGECYIRVYLITIQNGVTEKHALATVLVQTPSSSFDGKTRSVSMDAYTPLLELKENQPPIGYYVPGKTTIVNDEGETEEVETNIMNMANQLAQEHVRAPVVYAQCDTGLFYDFVADTTDTWLSFLTDLIGNAKYTFALDEYGRILFAPKQDTASLQPVWTYNDDNSSILYPELSLDHDMYEIPNVVEVVASNGKENFYAKVVNDDPNSPTSTINRGRDITYRVTDPELLGTMNQDRIDEYAVQLLRDLSTLEYTISYTHGYCPVRLGDCVRLNYVGAGLKNVKAKVISQSIKCEPGCPVTEKAVFTTKLWG